MIFAGHEPEGWVGGQSIPEDEFGLGYGIEDFFRLRESRLVLGPSEVCQYELTWSLPFLRGNVHSMHPTNRVKQLGSTIRKPSPSCFS